MRKEGFTLGEVLITLVIIGVIAALTIPNMQNTTNEQETKSSLKRALTLINQAISLEYSIYENEANGDEYLLAQMLKNHMGVATDWGTKFRTTDGMIYEVISGNSLSVDVNGKKGNGEEDKDLYIININDKHTATPDSDKGINILFGD